ALPEEEKIKSIDEIAPSPPMDGENMVTNLWDKHWPRWRMRQDEQRLEAIEAGAWWQQQIPPMRRIVESRNTVLEADVPIDAIARKRRVRTRKGTWWRVPEAVRKKQSP